MEERELQEQGKTLSLQESQRIISSTLTGENVENREARLAAKQSLVNALRMLGYDADWLSSFVIFLDAMDCYLFESTYKPAPFYHPDLDPELDLEYVPMEVFLGYEPEYESLPEPETSPAPVPIAPMPSQPYVPDAVPLSAPMVAPMPEPMTTPSMAEVAKVTDDSDFDIEYATSEHPLEQVMTPRVVGFAPTSDGPINVEDAMLYNQLRNLRAHIAEEEGIEVYRVFNNATLDEMAHKRPQTEEELLDIKGVGPKKLEWYGDEFMAAIADFQEEYEN